MERRKKSFLTFGTCFIVNFVCDNDVHRMLESTRAIVLRLTRHKDDSVIVDAYTLLRGKMSFVCKWQRGKRTSRLGSVLSPLNIVELAYDYRANRSMANIRAAETAVPFVSIPYEPLKSAIVLFLSDFMSQALKHEERNDALFLYVQSALEWLDSVRDGYSNFHIVFLVRLLRLLGFLPDVPGNVDGKLFDMRSGVLVDVQPGHNDYVDAEETVVLPLLLRLNFSNMSLLRINRHQRCRILELVLRYYRIHIPEFPELKSLDVMRELFA